MFIRIDDVTYVDTQINYSKRRNFIGPSENVKSTRKLCRRFSLYKINKNMERKPKVS